MSDKPESKFDYLKDVYVVTVDGRPYVFDDRRVADDFYDYADELSDDEDVKIKTTKLFNDKNTALVFVSGYKNELYKAWWHSAMGLNIGFE